MSNHNIKVLFIDDDPDVLITAATLLESFGYTVETASNGAEGIEAFSVTEIDICITDFMMPSINGLQVLKAIKEINPITPVIICSGIGDIDDIINAIRLGAYDYLEKPVRAATLRLAVESAWNHLKSLQVNENYKRSLELIVNEKTTEYDRAVRHLEAVKNHLIDANQRRDKAIKEIRRNETKYRALITNSPIGIATIDSNFRISDPNPAFLDILGFDDSHEIIENIITSPLFVGFGIIENLLNCINDNKECHFEKSSTDNRGITKYVKCYLTPIAVKEFDNETLLLIEDITLRKKSENEVERKARFDEISGLLNQNSFMPELHLSILKAKETRHCLALAHIDIDNFKHINDEYGHSKGNDVVSSVGGRIRSVINNEKDIGFRVGGDEFAVIFNDYPKKNLEIIIKRLFHALSSEPYSVGDITVKLTFSIGVGEYRNGMKADEFYEQVDAATYRAKNNGKNQFTFCED